MLEDVARERGYPDMQAAGPAAGAPRAHRTSPASTAAGRDRSGHDDRRRELRRLVGQARLHNAELADGVIEALEVIDHPRAQLFPILA